MDENKIHSILKKRFSGGLIDFYIFNMITLPLIAIVNIHSLDLLIFITCFVSYFGVFTVLTKGYTLGGRIVGTRIVNIDQSPPTNILKYPLRMLFALYAVVKYRVFNQVKVNSLGQLFYDEKFKTTVVDKDTSIDFNMPIKQYEFNLMFFYAKLFFIFWIVLFIYILIGNLL